MNSRDIFPIGKVSGFVPISGAKNSALLLLAAVALMKKPVVLNRMPDISDVHKMCDMLGLLNVKIKWVGSDALFLDPSDVKYCDLRVEACGAIRTSVLFLGVLLGRFGEANLRVPGGCEFGPRPINFHVEAMEALGAQVEQDGAYVTATLNQHSGGKVSFKRSSVTGTANAILCAVSLNTESIIEDAALEPEIDDLIGFLNQAGAKIQRLGRMIVVKGGEELTGTTYSVMPDRIEAGTFLIAAAVLGGKVTVGEVIPEHMSALISALRQAGADVLVEGKSVTVQMQARPCPVDIVAKEYPGFPTDLQPQWCVLAALARGTSQIVDAVFPSRFDHMAELEKMGVKFTKVHQGVSIEGVESLSGASLYAKNLRSAAALVLSGFVARGKTNIIRISEINRGYPTFFLKIKDILSS